MRLSNQKFIGILIPITMLIYNISWKIGAILGVFVILCILMAGRGKVNLKKSVICWSWAIYIILFAVILQFLRSYDFTISYVVGYILSAFILFMGLSSISTNNIISTFKILALYEALGVLLQVFLPSLYSLIIGIIVSPATKQSILSRVTEGYYTGFSREASLTVIFLILGIGILSIDFLYNKGLYNFKQKRKLFLQLTLLIVALLFTGKKAQPIFCLLALIITYFVYSNKKFKIIKISGAILLLILLIVIAYPYIQNIPSLARYTSLIDNIRQQQNIAIITSGRTEIYEMAIDLWKKDRFWGIGWNNFKNSVSSTAWFYRFDVHNCYLQVLCETGYIGAIPYYILMIVTFGRTIYSASFKRKLYTQVDSKIAFSIYYFSFFLFYGITGTCLYELSYYIPFFISIIWCEQEIKNYKLKIVSE